MNQNKNSSTTPLFPVNSHVRLPTRTSNPIYIKESRWTVALHVYIKYRFELDAGVPLVKKKSKRVAFFVCSLSDIGAKRKE